MVQALLAGKPARAIHEQDEHWGQLALQCPVRPGSFTERAGTLGGKYWPQHVRFDPNFDSLDGLEWLLENPEDVVVYGLIVRGFGPSVEGYGELARTGSQAQRPRARVPVVPAAGRGVRAPRALAASTVTAPPPVYSPAGVANGIMRQVAPPSCRGNRRVVLRRWTLACADTCSKRIEDVYGESPPPPAFLGSASVANRWALAWPSYVLPPAALEALWGTRGGRTREEEEEEEEESRQYKEQYKERSAQLRRSNAKVELFKSIVAVEPGFASP